jgi:SagB-type dehydrogenase family enzyme
VSTLTKFALSLLGRIGPRPAEGDAATDIALPPAQRTGGLPLMEALDLRHSTREFRPDPLPIQTLADLLWAAWGINRPADHEHTAPSAMNAQEIDVYAALREGLYRYDAERHLLALVAASDVRPVTEYQDFVDRAPVDLVYVADRARMRMVPAAARETYAAACAGAIAQNVYLYCASSGLATVVRAWFDREALEGALRLSDSQHVVLAQTVGYAGAS